MSRLIVKNLPKKVEEEKLRELFSQKGPVTDVQLKFTKEGKFRQFAFIGYETEEQAQEAIKFFDKTFIKTSRIIVELCKDLNQPVNPEINQDTNTKEQGTIKTKKGDKVRELLDQHKDDPLFKEFIESHAKAKSLWQDGISIPKEEEIETEKLHKKPEEEEEEKLASTEISDKDYMKSLMKKSDKAKKPLVELFTVKLRNLPKNTKRQDVLKFFKPLKPHSVRIPGLKLRFAYAGFKTKIELNKALAKHKSFLNGKQIEVYDFTNKNNLPDENNKNNNKKDKFENKKWENQRQQIEGEESVCESGKLFFRNLAYTVNEDDLQKVFEPFGPVAEINVPVDTVTRKIKGFGTVMFMMPEHAVKAYSDLNGSMFHGRMFHLLPGKVDDKETNEDLEDSTNFKKKKNEKLKQTAGSSHNWNTLFLGPNAVAEVLAKNYDVTKEGVLDYKTGGSNAAVRLALGETQIVQDMKKFLEDNGVYLKAFDGSTIKRSKTILLAKNLPIGTTQEELTNMFVKFGPLGRVLLPPSGVTCLIEYQDSSEAKKAFKGMAYKMFKGQPLYLEWAPENTFDTKQPIPSKLEKNEENPSEVTEPIESNKTAAPEINDEEEDEPPEDGTTLFIKNLNFNTQEPAVRNHFKKIGKIHSIQIAKKPDPNNPKIKISAGYGFIQFKKVISLEKALRTLQFTELESKKIELKRSDRILSTDLNTSRKVSKKSIQTGTKILIRNIPFQAKESEIRDIFKVFGEVKALRLPKKTNADSHRGFGFCEYFTKEEAKRAFDTLSESTHLYGRRLVLEWALEENVEEIRKRTASHF
ncbi:unnamed protein product, partial [Sphagnum compactum]